MHLEECAANWIRHHSLLSYARAVVLVLVLCEPGDVWNNIVANSQCFMSGTVNVAAFIIVHCQALNPMVGRFKRSKVDTVQSLLHKLKYGHLSFMKRSINREKEPSNCEEHLQERQSR
ncbi:hypothetical protein HAX54_045073 [Datura stramonium]|uniref:Uncharacterized protein n=1 Tax=Datura stramonium TaxID=4076 RepID=A0ABS8SPY1_DATST|nr:hypothetical protein [Datura stramonium]